MIESQRKSIEQLDAELADLAIEGYWKSIVSLPREPTPKGEPWLWRWRDVYPKLFEAADTIDLEQGAERRSLRLCTPGLSWKTTTEILTAAIQMVLPGERAQAHRHSPGALRFSIEGNGGYTTVNGEQFVMEPADLILTPQRSWHDHGNVSQAPAVWLDILDAPLLRQLNAVFQDPFDVPVQPLTRDTGYSRATYGAVRPERTDAAPAGIPYHYKGVDALALLRSLPWSEADPYNGVAVRYHNPVDNGPTLPTVQCRLHRLSPALPLVRHRHTWNVIYHVVSGRGETLVGGRILAWENHDTFSMPSWHWHQHRILSDEAILFTTTDEPIFRTLNLERVESA